MFKPASLSSLPQRTWTHANSSSPGTWLHVTRVQNRSIIGTDAPVATNDPCHMQAQARETLIPYEHINHMNSKSLWINLWNKYENSQLQPYRSCITIKQFPQASPIIAVRIASQSKLPKPQYVLSRSIWLATRERVAESLLCVVIWKEHEKYSEYVGDVAVVTMNKSFSLRFQAHHLMHHCAPGKRCDHALMHCKSYWMRQYLSVKKHNNPTTKQWGKILLSSHPCG